MDGISPFKSCLPSDTRGPGDLGCTRSIGSRSAIDFSNTLGIMAQRQNSAVATNPLCSQTHIQKPARKVALFTFQQHHHVQPWLMCLRQVNVPILLSLPQMRNVGMTIELHPRGDKITCPAFGVFSSPAECSTMGHIVLDLTSLTYQPTTKSSNRSGHTKKHVIFAMSERKPSTSGSDSRHA